MLLQGKLTSFPQYKQTLYDNLSQFLQYVPTVRLQSYTTGRQFLALKSLQIEGFLKSNEPPIHRYAYAKGDKNRKIKTESHPRSASNFILQWTKRSRGTLAVPCALPSPSVNTHTMNMVPQLLDMMVDNMDILKKWGTWTMGEFPGENCNLRTKIDGDFLQVFVALHKCGIFKVLQE